jgi:type II secretory pathway pseudopilin PulG
MNERGFALLEWVIASALVLIIAAALFASMGPVHDVFDRAQHASELTAGARTALDAIVSDVREAHSRPAIAPHDQTAAALLRPLDLLEDLGGGAAGPIGHAIAVRRVPLAAAQARLRSAADAGDTQLSFDMAARCSTGTEACGFRHGDHAVLLADGVAEVVTVEEPLADAVVLTAPLANTFPADSVVCRILTITYGLRGMAEAAARLVRLTDGGAEQPLLEDVVGFDVEADDQDVGSMRRVRLRLRVQAAPDHLRGPASYLFARGGTATSARRWVPDVELRADVALRNRGASW